MRGQYAPGRTWAAFIIVGGVLTLVRNSLYGIPVTPVRIGLTPLIVCTFVGGAYFVTVEGWLYVRKWWNV